MVYRKQNIQFQVSCRYFWVTLDHRHLQHFRGRKDLEIILSKTQVNSHLRHCKRKKKILLWLSLKLRNCPQENHLWHRIDVSCAVIAWNSKGAFLLSRVGSISPLPPREDRKMDLFKGFIEMTDFYDLFNTSWMVQKEDEVSFRINIITYPKKA